MRESTVTDAGRRAVASGCRQLEFLNIEGSSLSSSSLVYMATRCQHSGGWWPGIAAGCGPWTCMSGEYKEGGLHAVCKKCEQLNSLTTSGAEFALGACIAAIGRNCTRLGPLSVVECPTFSDENLATVVN
eukprot:jgi/Mesvir1/28478/Mv15898-RA.1